MAICPKPAKHWNKSRFTVTTVSATFLLSCLGGAKGLPSNPGEQQSHVSHGNRRIASESVQGSPTACLLLMMDSLTVDSLVTIQLLSLLGKNAIFCPSFLFPLLYLFLHLGMKGKEKSDGEPPFLLGITYGYRKRLSIHLYAAPLSLHLSVSWSGSEIKMVPSILHAISF